MLLTVTIVTPVFNGGPFIESAIRSVLAQTYPYIEYIIMDGASTDDTVAIAERFDKHLAVISEPDKGQSDAINKGWLRASGDVLAWLCADDLYEPNTVEIAVKALTANPDARWVYGSGKSLDAEGRPRPFRHPVEPWNYERLIGTHNYIIQPSVFIRNSTVQQYGELRSDLHYTMDYEYWLRIGRVNPGLFCPDVRVMAKRYASAKTHSGGIRRLDELMQLMTDYGRTDLPSGYRHEWVTAYTRAGLSALLRGQWKSASELLSQLGRYPSAIPRGVLKAALEQLPPSVDRHLRQWFLRSP